MSIKKSLAAILVIALIITSLGIIPAIADGPVNLALSATATANSEYPGYGPDAAKDLLLGGDWATYGGAVGQATAGAASAPTLEGKVTFTYTWSTPVSVGSIKLANRGGELITNAKIYVNDVDTGMEIIKISNDAYAPTVVSMGQVRTNVTKLQLVVLSGAGNFGLQGFEVYSALDGNNAFLATVTKSTEYPGSEYYAINARAIGGNQVWASYGEPLPWIQYNFASGITVGRVRLLGRGGEYITKAKLIVNGDVANAYTVQGINGTTAIDYYLPGLRTNVTSLKLLAIESVGNNVGLQGFEVYSDWQTSSKLWETQLNLANDASSIPATITQSNSKSIKVTITDNAGIGGWFINNSVADFDFTDYKTTAKVRFFAKSSVPSAMRFAVNNQNGNAYGNIIQKSLTTSWQEFIMPLSDMVTTAPPGDEANNTKMRQIRITETLGLGVGDVFYLSNFEVWTGDPASTTMPEKVWTSNTNANGFGAINDVVASAKIITETDYRFDNAVRITALTDSGLTDGCYIGNYTGAWNNIDISTIKDTGYIRFYAKATVPVVQDFYSFDSGLSDYGYVNTISLTSNWQEYTYSIASLRSNANPFCYFVFRNNGANHLMANQSIYVSNIEVWPDSPDVIPSPKSGLIWKSSNFVNNFGTVGDNPLSYAASGSIIGVDEPFASATRFTASAMGQGLGSMMFMRNIVADHVLKAPITENIKNNGYIRFYAKASKAIRVKVSTSYGALSVYSSSKVINVGSTWQEYMFKINDLIPLNANPSEKKSIDTIWLGHYDWTADSAIAPLDKANLSLLTEGQSLEISPIEIFSGLPTTTYASGDVNGDGKVSISDLLIIKKHLLGISLINGLKFIDSDINKDNLFDVTELASVKTMLLSPLTVKLNGWDPGAVGYDVNYTFDLFKLGKKLIPATEYTVTSSTAGVSISGNQVTVPYSVRQTTNVCALQFSLVSNPTVTTTYSIPLVNNAVVSFEDNFNGTTLDSSKWIPYMNDVPFGNNSTQVIGHQNAVSVSNGVLSLSAKKETVTVGANTYDYITGMIQSNYGFDQNGGTFAGRFRFPQKGGINSAFWLTPRNYEADFLFMDKTGAGCNEIDVFEQSNYFNNMGKTYISGQHYFTKNILNENAYSHTKSTYVSSGNGSDIDIGWHDFCLVWTATGTYYYHNGKLIQKVEGLSANTTVNNNAHMLLTAGVASINGDNTNSWYGTMNDSDFPQSFEVDYIRVYN